MTPASSTAPSAEAERDEFVRRHLRRNVMALGADYVLYVIGLAFMTQAMSGGMETFLELGLNFMTLVHGEQEFEYVRPVRIGETLTLTGRIADVYDKTSSSGGVLDFVVCTTPSVSAHSSAARSGVQSPLSRSIPTASARSTFAFFLWSSANVAGLQPEPS